MEGVINGWGNRRTRARRMREKRRKGRAGAEDIRKI